MGVLLSNQLFKEESKFLKAAKEWLEAQPDIKVVRVSDRYQKGISDLILCVRGQFVAIELKDDTGKPSPHQLLFIREVKKAGGIGDVCYTLKEVGNLVDVARSRRAEW